MRKLYPLFILSLFTFFLRAQDLTIKGSVTVQSDGLLFVQGNVLIDNGGTLDIQSSGTSHGKVQVDYGIGLGTWRCDGTTTSTGGDGEVHFLGSAVSYDVKGTSVSFPNLIVDITDLVGSDNVAKVNVIDNIIITKSLDLNDGRMITSAGKEVYVSNNAAGAIKATGSGFGANKSNFIEGTLRREVITGPNSYYKFPIGTTPNPGSNKKGYNPAFIDLRTGVNTINALKPSNVTSIAGKFVEKADPGIIHYNNAAYTCYFTSALQYLELFWMIQDYGYWDFTPNGDKSGWWYSFYCKPDFDYIFDHNFNLTHMKIVKAPGTFNPDPGADWTPYVWLESGNNCDGVAVDNNQVSWIPAPYIPFNPTDSIRASELKTFSRFALSGGTGAGLPIELLYLEAHPVDNSFIQVDWATATETNNSGFEVQRSTDGLNFTTIGWRDGAGNSSSTQFYGFPDNDVVPNKLYYYRLKQIDFNGASNTTDVVSAMIVSSSTFTISEFIPNPTENNSRIEVLTSAERDINVTVYNTLGQIISKSDRHLVTGTNTIDFDFNLFADGTYFAIFQTDNEIYNRKLILTK